MLSRDMTSTTAWALRSAAAAVTVAVAVTACGVSGPDPVACKAAMQASYVKAAAGKGQFATDPPACKGLPSAEVERLAQQVRDGG